jgi:hypothetical protein
VSTLSVRDICERYAVTEHTVLGWIRSGQLMAINVGRRAGAKKPRWRVTATALVAFESLRSSATQPPPVKPTRAKSSSEVIKFYE